MKLYKHILMVVAVALSLSSCEDQMMEWGRPDGYGDVNIADIPLELREKLANYDYIKAYAEQYMPGVVIGVGLGADNYIADEEYRKVANDNFQMITTGNAMKHSSVVNNRGELVFTTIDKFFESLPADMQVYGHTLIWHTQQRAGYLNGIIAPDIIVEPDGAIENVIVNTGFETGNITGWGAWSSAGASAAISEKGKGYEGDYAMMLNNPVAGSNYSAQAYYSLPVMDLELGETYVYSAMVYSEEGNDNFQMQLQSRVTYSGNGYKSMNIPAGKWTLFEFEFEMTEAIIGVDPDHLTIDFGAAAGTYYIDNIQFGKKREEPDLMLNVFENSDFETGATDPWGCWGDQSPTKDISAQGEGYNSDYAMVLTNTVDGDSWQAQAAYTLDFELEVGETYIAQFWAKADHAAGWLQVITQNSTTYGSQMYGTDFTVGTEWMEYTQEFTIPEDKADIDRILFQFGTTAGVYHIDNIKFGKKLEVTTPPLMLNVFDNSEFETGTTDPWGCWGDQSPTKDISAQGEGYNSDYAMVLTNTVDGDSWQAQAAYTLDFELEVGETYIAQFWAKADHAAGWLQMITQNSTSYGSQMYGTDFTIGTTWMEYTQEFVIPEDKADIDRILFQFGTTAGVYHIDNVRFGKKLPAAAAAPAKKSKPQRAIIQIEKTDEQKREILTGAMKNWITGMIEHCKERVRMWDVLNEPITDGSKLRGVDEVPDASEMDNDDFFWGQYLGKEYALKAFQFAREADAEAKLFINDYNLETNPSKLAALIDYVKWIDEQNGSPIVDGIGTQMHLHVSITREQLDEMFKTMAATGKLVRVTELDVKFEWQEPASQIAISAEQAAEQAAVYQMVFESFKANVPPAQQSGITIWSLTDHPREHEYWLKNDLPNIFDGAYNRKHAYKGVCDGIAGKDVSEEFSGEDWKSFYETEEEETEE